MAEPLSIGASIISVLQLTAAVFHYVNRVNDAAKDRSLLLDGIASACTPLYMLRDRLDEANQNAEDIPSVRSLGGPNGPLRQFKGLLEQLARKFAPVERKSKRLDSLCRSLAWPFNKDEVQSILQALESLKSLFHLALQNDTL